ncbi:MAG: glycosyltransferase [Candidatus Omnitrophica bacterium]|nr:glycosyltransferase [Candidatus Omnitrophota bacterium]
MERIAAVIVTYNNSEMLLRLLEDIMSQTRMADEIIIVDNGNTDDTQNLVKEKFSQAKYIKIPQNSGSAGGYYTGIQAAMVKNDFVWTLDDDVRVPADSLKELIDGFKRLAISHKIAIARSVVFKEPKPKAEILMDNFTWRGCLIKTEVFGQGCVINKDFFIYGEDSDLSYQLSKKGYVFFWIPTSVCQDTRTSGREKYRFFGKTSEIYSDNFRLYYAFRNHIYILMRYGYYLKATRVILYGLKASLCFLSKYGLTSVSKIKAIIKGIIHGFRGKLGKTYNEKH